VIVEITQNPMELKPPRTGEHRYAVAIRAGANLWLTLWVRRSPKGEFFVMVPRTERDWTPHASYHLDGTHHMKSYGHPSFPRKRQPLTGLFKGTENLCCFAGHATNLATCDAALFDGVLEVSSDVLGPKHGTVCVDLVEPGYQPVMALSAHSIVRRETFTTTVPHVVITIYSSDETRGIRQDGESGGGVKQDEKRLLKLGLFWAAILAGFWLSVSVIHRRVYTAAAIAIWSVFLYVVFYRDAQRRNPK